MTVERSIDLTRQSRTAAERQASAIVAYWAERGHDVYAEVSTLPFDDSRRYRQSIVRTDMINGLPRALAYGKARGVR